jgi:mono/diheme cytochrome c family protein
MRHVRVRASSLAVMLIALTVFSGSWVLAERGGAARGKQIYEQTCLRCHGQKLDGRGPEAQYLKVPPANLHALSSRTKSDWELLVIISHGVMFTPMHGFRDVLSEQDIKDVLTFIRTEAPFKPLAARFEGVPAS